MKTIKALPQKLGSKANSVKALALLSGGLDSHLAIKVVQEQGIEVEALNFITIFCNCTARTGGCIHEASKASKSLGIKLKTINFSADLLQSVRQPKYGYGRNLNPCIDCRVTMFSRAKEYMREIGADFLITGEVLDSRPMSQTKNNILFIESESGLDGLILRPLSAKDFKPSIAESNGWIDRDQLFDIKGRTRRRQIALAGALNVVDYPCPAGGCLLTDPEFSCKLRDLMADQSDFDIEDVKLLKYGRHFRIDRQAKIIVGRSESDNAHIKRAARDGDLILMAKGRPGPITLLRNSRQSKQSEDLITLAVNITAAYGSVDQELRDQNTEIVIEVFDPKAVAPPIQFQILAVEVPDRASFRKYLINLPSESLKRKPRERRKISSKHIGKK